MSEQKTSEEENEIGEIKDEMKADGLDPDDHLTDEEKESSKDKKPEKDDEEESEDDSKKSPDSDDEEESESDDSKKSDDEESEDEESDDEDDDEEDDDGQPPKLNTESRRSPQFVPLSKHQGIKKSLESDLEKANDKIADLTSQLGGLDGGDSDNEITPQIEKWAKDNNTTPEAVLELRKILLPENLIPEDAMKAIGTVLERAESEKQEQAFDTEFDALVKEDDSVEKHKKKLREMAFTEGYDTLSLYEIWNRHLKSTVVEQKKTFEPKGNKAPKDKSKSGKDLATIDLDDPKVMESLTDDEFDKATELQAKKSGGRLIKSELNRK